MVTRSPNLTPTSPRSRATSGRLTAAAAAVVLRAMLLVELGIFVSLLVSWPPAGGDGRTVAAAVAALVALKAWWHAVDGPTDGGES